MLFCLNIMYFRCEILTKGCWHALHIRNLSIADSGEIQILVDGKVLDHADLYVKSKAWNACLVFDTTHSF